MSEPELPPPERCANNLHRAPDRANGAPEATDLCRNPLGVVHMLDCPLFVGRRCGQFEDAPVPHPVVTDAEILAAREELQRDFLGWPYRQRVRNLARPRDLVPRRVALEPTPAPAEDDEAPIALRVPPPAAPAEPAPLDASGAPPAPDPGPGTPPAEPVGAALDPEPAAEPPAPPPVPAVESYPGQRRSEDRGRKKKRLPARPAGPVLPPAAETDPGIDGEVDFGAGLDGAPDEAWEPSVPSPPPGPKTVEQLLEFLPEAALPAPGAPARGPREHREGARGDRRGDGRGRHRGRPEHANRGARPPRPDEPRREPRGPQPGARQPGGPPTGERRRESGPPGERRGDRPGGRHRRRGRRPRGPGGPGAGADGGAPGGGPPGGGAPPAAPSA
jgi:translation initiation factor IF-2